MPERPFFRNAIRAAPQLLLEVLKEHIDPMTMAFDQKVAGRMGVAMVGQVQRSITVLRQPPNATATLLRKRSSNPLIDTGFMRQSVTHRVIK